MIKILHNLYSFNVPKYSYTEMIDYISKITSASYLKELQSFDILIEERNIRLPLPYTFQLATKEWQAIREKVFERDNSTCQICKKGNPYMKYKGEFNYHKVREATKEEINLFKENLKQLMSEKEAKYSKESRLYKIYRKQRRGISNPFVDDWLDLHVHHKYYIKNTLAWDYELDSLTTLCATCHADFHINNNISIFNYKPNFDLPLESQLSIIKDCSRCNGLKIIEQYKHIEAGICFSCRGTGYVCK